MLGDDKDGTVANDGVGSLLVSARFDPECLLAEDELAVQRAAPQLVTEAVILEKWKTRGPLCARSRAQTVERLGSD